MNPYDELGVAQDADANEIKRAYRKRAQRDHPDRAGGNEERFKRLAIAYDMLSDPKRKERFDKFGESGTDSVAQQALAEVASMFVILAGQHDVDHTDIREIILQQVKGAAEGRARNIQQLRHIIGKLESAKKRVKKRTSGDNLVVQFFDADIVNKRNAIARIERELERGKIMLEIVEDYEYTIDQGGAYIYTGAQLQWQR